MQVAEIELYKILKTKFSESEGESIVAGLEHKVQVAFEDRKNNFATKEDIARLEDKIDTKIAETKAELIKWMFIFWIGQLASFIAIAKFILH